jgi:hypothetical protein
MGNIRSSSSAPSGSFVIRSLPTRYSYFALKWACENRIVPLDLNAETPCIGDSQIVP